MPRNVDSTSRGPGPDLPEDPNLAPKANPHAEDESKGIKPESKTAEAKRSLAGRVSDTQAEIDPTGKALAIDAFHHVSNPLSEFNPISPVEYVAYIMKAMRANTVDLISPAKSETPNITIALYAQGGMGDVMFVYKTAMELIERGCEVNIAIMKGREMTQDEILGKLSSLEGIDRVNLMMPRTNDPNTFKTDCVIVGPTRPRERQIHTFFPELAGFHKEYVQEYSSQNTFTLHNQNMSKPSYDLKKSSGLRPYELGIFKGDGLKPPLSIQERIKAMDVLRANNPSFDAIFNKRETSSYLETSKLFFGYAHESFEMKKFTEVVAASEADNPANLDIILPWRDVPKDRQKYEFYSKCSYSKASLKASGITNVEVIKNGKMISSETISDKQPPKTLRIHNVFPLSKEDFNLALRVSEPLVLITGDQSWNEAMLYSDKIISYEMMQWKRAFSAAQKAYAEELPEVKDFMEAQLYGPKAIANSLKELYRANLEAQTKGERTPVQQFHENVMECEDFPDSLMKQCLIFTRTRNAPKTQAAYLKIEQKIRSAFLVTIQLHSILKLLSSRIFSASNVPPYLRSAIEKNTLEKTTAWFNSIKDQPEIPSELRKAVEEGLFIAQTILEEADQDESKLSKEILITAGRNLFKVMGRLNQMCSSIFENLQTSL